MYMQPMDMVPVIWAGAEMLNLLKHQHPRMNDSAVHFYPTEQQTKEPISSILSREMWICSRSKPYQRKESCQASPIGDSTVKCGAGNGEDNKWGWGSYLQNYFDTTASKHWKLCIRRKKQPNLFHGRSLEPCTSCHQTGWLCIDWFRTQMTVARWIPDVHALLCLVLEMTLKKVVMEKDGSTEEVYSFGHYIRMYIRQAKVKGAKVIVMSHTRVIAGLTTAWTVVTRLTANGQKKWQNRKV